MTKATNLVDFFLTDPYSRFLIFGRFETKVKPFSSTETTEVDAEEAEIVLVGFEGSSKSNPSFSTRT